MIALDDLCETPPRRDPQPKEKGPRTSLKSAIETLERQMIAEALEAYRHNQQQTARALGLSRQGLINKLNRYGLR